MRRAVLAVAGLNFAYFLVEVIAAGVIGSASLLADSVDFLEDTAINLLVFFAAVWPATRRRIAAKVLAGLILLPVLAALTMIVRKIIEPVPPAPEGLTVIAAGAVVVNVVCAIILLRVRDSDTPLARGAWLAARNDALSNVIIIIAGLLTFIYPTAWFDIAAATFIAVVNLSAAKEVWEKAE